MTRVSPNEAAHWRTINAELEQKVLRRLCHECGIVTGEPLPTSSKTWFFAIHLAVQQKLNDALLIETDADPPWAKLREVVGRLSTSELSSVYGLIFLGFMGGLRTMWNVDKWKIIMGAAADLYVVPQSTVASWIQLVRDHETEDDFDLRVFARLGDAIAGAVGLPLADRSLPGLNRPSGQYLPGEQELLDKLGASLHDLTHAMDPLHWRLFMAEVASQSNKMCKEPDWKRRLDEKIRQACFAPGVASGSGPCFIATAACGANHADVALLRHFRDGWLRPLAIGRALIAAYEFASPPLAQLIARSAWARWFVRRTVVCPARYFADLAMQWSRWPSTCAGPNVVRRAAHQYRDGSPVSLLPESRALE